eukprot:CAMPEP_0201581664 /NCGR_PEP_ID=MMETSP0190_2-20130828/73235_1 /ASSEMBLY_ACC=CAM_ASM_000263 /TAXON_ID=37353 /ORGANISM="Rosalina sp." /LENGTH=82 /DNA_ID=CAMNT_0048020129 /DNA_START=73 /DNA_END=317 /DNA_ORIENTATION=+
MSDNKRKAPPSSWRPPRIPKRVSSTSLLIRASDYDEEPKDNIHSNDVRLQISDGIDSATESTPLIANIRVSKTSPNMNGSDP